VSSIISSVSWWCQLRSLLFNSIEIDGIETGVVELLNDAQDLMVLRLALLMALAPSGASIDLSRNDYRSET
jgi:hypothetical protein